MLTVDRLRYEKGQCLISRSMHQKLKDRMVRERKRVSAYSNLFAFSWRLRETKGELQMNR